MCSSINLAPTKPLSRLLHALLLMILLLSSNGLTPLLMVVFSQDHTLENCFFSHGEMQVVLGHRGPVFSYSASQDSIAEFGQSDPSLALQEPDHVFILKTIRDTSIQNRRAESVSILPAPEMSPPLWIIQLKSHTPPPCIKHYTQVVVWSPGLQVQASRTILLC